MKRPLALGLLSMGTLMAGTTAFAEDNCHVPIRKWQPRQAVQKLAEEHGWTVRRIKSDDGCYHIDARDAQGREIDVNVDPATLAIVSLSLEGD